MKMIKKIDVAGDAGAAARYNYACYNFEGFGVWRSNLKECHEGNCHPAGSHRGAGEERVPSEIKRFVQSKTN
jgi:hypothetical protein